MRASTRVRVSAPTSAHPRTTLETVITLTLRSCAMSFRRTGVVGALDMSIRAPVRAGRCSASLQKREYTKLRRVAQTTDEHALIRPGLRLSLMETSMRAGYIGMTVRTRTL